MQWIVGVCAYSQGIVTLRMPKYNILDDGVYRMNDDKDFIDLDSTQNWSQLDVKREMDNLEVNKETGERYEFARGFADDAAKKKEEEILLDGLTSGLNYIPEEFLMAADEKHEEDRLSGKANEGKDVSWAYRKSEPATDLDDTLVPISDLKQAEEEATRLRAMEVSAATEKEEKEKQEQQKTDYVGAQGNDEIEEIRKKNLEAQIAKHAQINASDAAVAANIAARKKAREEAAQAAQAIVAANAKAREEEKKKAQEEMMSTMDMFSNEFVDLDALDAPVMTKEERIAAANKNSFMEESEADIEEHEQDEAGEETEDDAVETAAAATVAVAAAKKKKKKRSAAEEYASWADDVSEEREEEAEDDEEDDEDDEYEGEGFFGKIVAFFKNLSGLDILVMGTGILVVTVAVITALIYSSSKQTQAKIAEFQPLGANMQTIGIAGSGQFTAIADARNAVPEIEVEEPEEEEPKEYVEKDDESTVSVTMSLTSVKKDLKI
ncbi:MAG: hypothetical protein Q4A15_13380, partial [Prevotellaceae bacterium]|nr:hypothetical protein [Prevotellaceae bacterium]